MDLLRIGLVGAGYAGIRIGTEFVEQEHATLAALADPEAEARRSAGEKLDIPPSSTYENLDSMLAVEDIQALVVATPPALHEEHVTTAAEMGLDVLCEKPFCTTVAEGRRLLDVIERSGQTVRVGFQRRVEPPCRLARETLAGESITTFSAEIVDDWLPVFKGTWRMDPNMSGGGQGFDTGNHLVDLLAWLMGMSPTSVSAAMDFRDTEHRVDIRAALVLRFGNDVVGTVNIVGDAPRAREHVHVWSTDTGVYLDAKEWAGRSLTIIDPDGTERTPCFAESKRETRADAFVDAVYDQEGEDHLATPADGVRAVAVLQAAYQAAHSGETVPINDVWVS